MGGDTVLRPLNESVSLSPRSFCSEIEHKLLKSLWKISVSSLTSFFSIRLLSGAQWDELN